MQCIEECFSYVLQSEGTQHQLVGEAGRKIRLLRGTVSQESCASWGLWGWHQTPSCPAPAFPAITVTITASEGPAIGSVAWHCWARAEGR